MAEFYRKRWRTETQSSGEDAGKWSLGRPQGGCPGRTCTTGLGGRAPPHHSAGPQNLTLLHLPQPGVQGHFLHCPPAWPYPPETRALVEGADGCLLPTRQDRGLARAAKPTWGVPTWVSSGKPHLAPGMQESYALNFPKHGWDTLTQSL